MSRMSGGMTFPGSLLRDNRNFSYGETPTEPAVTSRVASRVSQLAPSSPSAASSPSPSPWYYAGQEQKAKAAEGVQRGQEFNRMWDSLPDDKKLNFSKGTPAYGDFYGDFGKGRVYGAGVVGAGHGGVTTSPIDSTTSQTPLGKAPIDPMAVAKANALAHYNATGGLDLPAPAAPAAGLANAVGAMAPSSPVNFSMGPTPGGQPQHVTTINELQNQLLAQKMQGAGVIAPPVAPAGPAAPVAPVAAPQNTPSSAPALGASATGIPTPAEIAGSRSLGMTVDKYRQIAQESASIGVTPDQYMHLTPKEVTTLQQQQMRNKGTANVATIAAQSRQNVAAGTNQTRQTIAAGNNQSHENIASGNNQSHETIAAGNNQSRETVATSNNQSKEGIAQVKADQNDQQYQGKLAEQHAATEERIRHDLKIEGQKGRLAPDKLAQLKLEWDKENNKRALYKLPALPYPDYLTGGQKPTYSQTATNDKGEKVGLNPQNGQWEAILP